MQVLEAFSKGCEYTLLKLMHRNVDDRLTGISGNNAIEKCGSTLFVPSFKFYSLKIHQSLIASYKSA